MHFKYPENLFFLFLLIIPVLVHLFQLRRFKTEYFTNVRFLRDIIIKSRKSSKIKKWLLLLTRCLFIICLVLAFAQPYFTSKNIASASNETYIVLDNSFSMQAKGKSGELLKRAVQDLLEEIPDGFSFSLLTNSESFWDTDAKSVRGDLHGISYSSTPFDISNLYTKIKSHKPSSQKTIIVITDAVNIKQKQLEGLDTNNTVFVIPKSEQKNNVSIDSVYISQTSDDFYEITIETTHHGKDLKPIQMSLFNEDKLVAKSVVKFETNKKQTVFSIPRSSFHGFVSILDDGLAYDNNYYFSISDVEKSNVIAVGATDKNQFLSRIYTSDEFNYSSINLSSLQYNIIENQDAVVINELENLPAALQTTLKSFAEKGGNIIFIPSSKNTVFDANNTFLRQFGDISLNKLENREKLITSINFSHPLFSGVFEKKVSNFQYPKTKSSYNISSNTSPILSYEDGNTFLTSIQNAVSSVYVFAAPIENANSNFKQSPLIVPVFYKMAQQNNRNSIVAMKIGTDNQYIVRTTLSKDEIIEIKGKDEEFIPIQQILSNKVKISLDNYPTKAGNYQILKHEDWIENISFNYSREESNINNIDRDMLSEFNTNETIESFFNKIHSNQTDNLFWKWFVIFALLFLMAEVFIIKFINN